MKKALTMEVIAHEQVIYNKIFESSNEGIFVLNKEGKIIMVNGAAMLMFLRAENSIIGHSIKELLPDFELPINSKQTLYGVSGDNSIIPLSVRIIKNSQEKYTEIVFLTNRKNSANEHLGLRINETKNNAILRAIPDIVFIFDKDGTYLDVHAPEPANLVVSKEELLGKSMYDYMTADLCDRVMSAYAKSKKTGQTQILEYDLRLDDEVKYFQARIVSKEVDNFLTIIKDISYSKKKEVLTEQMSVALETIATNGDISLVATQIVDTIENFIGKCRVSVLLLDKEMNQLNTLVAPNLPEAYNKLINGLKIGPNVGSCGTAAFLKKEIIVNDISTDSRWNGYKGIAAKYGLKACWSFPIFSKDDQVLGTFAIYSNQYREITPGEKVVLKDTTKLLRIAFEHQLTQESLKESNRKYSALINNLPGVVYWCLNDEDWTMEYLNENIKTLTGYDPEQFFGNSKLSFNSLIHVDDRDMVRDEVQKAVELDRSFEIIYRITTADNEEKWVWEQGAQTVDSDNKTHSLEGYIMDITERKKAEEILKQNENRLRDYAANLEREVKQRTNEVLATLDQMESVNLSLEKQVIETKNAESKALENQELFSGIAKNFPKGVIVVISKEMEIVYCEGEALKDFELDEELVKGATLKDISFMDEDAKLELKDRIERTLEGNHLSFEVDYFDQFLAVNTTPLYDSDKNITRALFVYNNITHQKQIELNIQKSLEQQQELNELKSRFVSMASHEFRTPLTAIMSSAILLGKRNLDEFSEKKERYLAQINTNIQHMVSLLDDFLTISKLEEGKVIVTPEKLDLILFSNTIVEELSDSINTGHTFVKEYDQGFYEINHDPKLMRNILYNLFSNAIKYSPKNSEIKIIIKTEKDKFVLSVSDKGIGIPKKDQKNLFERFFRAKNVSNIEGTGLGLNIIKQHVEIMGGVITFESKLNKGSCFKVELPIGI